MLQTAEGPVANKYVDTTLFVEYTLTPSHHTPVVDVINIFSVVMDLERHAKCTHGNR